ncbi:MAG: hypothetical protein A2177_15770 [Spirochaetes bacterium RBG_13_68_11]|nr:MAG: hypothetical protein A2177_15770 [Spirochaetes bacterium RBG_13_68_11]
MVFVFSGDPGTKYSLGHGFIPPSVHAGGLRYHGAAPIPSLLLAKGIIRTEALKQTQTFEAAVLFAWTEGIFPAPESAHAIATAILFNLSGHGHFDMSACEQYFAGKIVDFEYPEEAICKAEAELPKAG